MWMEAEGRFVQWLCNEPKTHMLLFPPDSGTNGRDVFKEEAQNNNKPDLCHSIHQAVLSHV